MTTTRTLDEAVRAMQATIGNERAISFGEWRATILCELVTRAVRHVRDGLRRGYKDFGGGLPQFDDMRRN